MAKKKPYGKKKKWKRYVWAFAVVLAVSAIGAGYSYYEKVYGPSVNVPDDADYIYIPTGSNYSNLLSILTSRQLVASIANFDWVAHMMRLDKNVHAGRYRLNKGMSNEELVRELRSGIQEPINLVINKFRTKSDFVSFISQKLEVDSSTLMIALNDEVYLRNYNVTVDEAMTLFIPNTYEFYWTTSSEQFMQRMKKEYDRFWNNSRLQKAAALGLTSKQVMILASIIEEETNYDNEKSSIASVYLNRINKGMKLQADPTTIFAIGNFSITRVMDVHIEYDSPYNTYKYPGLPPGPICTPSITTIDAVLNSSPSDYLYFCVSADKPGTHVFAKTLQEHKLNARRYREYEKQHGR